MVGDIAEFYRRPFVRGCWHCAKDTGDGEPLKVSIRIRLKGGGFAKRGSGSDNLAMENSGTENDGVERAVGRARQSEPFSHGALVIAILSNPREKFWGMILALAPAGVSLSGVELASFEDLTVLVRDGEPFTPAVVFFPMHRIERVELDLPDGNLPSLSQRFLAKTGLQPSVALAPRTSDPVRDYDAVAPKERE